MALYLDTAIPTSKVSVHAAHRASIKSESFDHVLLLLPLATGFAAAAASLASPGLFGVLLLADLWLLGYHHVVAAYQRLASNAEALGRNRFLACDLLLLLTAATVGLALVAGSWVAATAFLHFQWFRYMRQGHSVARMYFRATPEGQVAGIRDIPADLVIYLVPIYALAVRSAAMGDLFLNLPVRTMVLPNEAIVALGFAATIAVAMWALQTGAAFARGTLDALYAGFVLSHAAMFLVAYVAIEDVNTGWLAVDVWHNIQYMLVLWMKQTRNAGGVDMSATTIESPGPSARTSLYFLSCLTIATAVYVALGRFVFAVGGGMAIAFGIYIGINAHHYIVDGVIWKRRSHANRLISDN